MRWTQDGEFETFIGQLPLDRYSVDGEAVVVQLAPEATGSKNITFFAYSGTPEESPLALIEGSWVGNDLVKNGDEYSWQLGDYKYSVKVDAQGRVSQARYEAEGSVLELSVEFGDALEKRIGEKLAGEIFERAKGLEAGGSIVGTTTDDFASWQFF